MTDAVSAKTGEYFEPALRVKIAIKTNYSYATLRAAQLELLPEFAEDVEMVEWQDFLAGKEA